jgi:hypothetical protein
MGVITLSAEAASKLRQAEVRVEIQDEAGRSLGYFVPAAERELYRTAEIPPFNAEELRRLAAQGGGRTLAEIMADLEGRQ